MTTEPDQPTPPDDALLAEVTEALEQWAFAQPLVHDLLKRTATALREARDESARNAASLNDAVQLLGKVTVAGRRRDACARLEQQLAERDAQHADDEMHLREANETAGAEYARLNQRIARLEQQLGQVCIELDHERVRCADLRRKLATAREET